MKFFHITEVMSYDTGAGVYYCSGRRLYLPQLTSNVVQLCRNLIVISHEVMISSLDNLKLIREK